MEKSKVLFGSAEGVVESTKKAPKSTLIKDRVRVENTKAQIKNSQPKGVHSVKNQSPNPNKVHGIKPGK